MVRGRSVWGWGAPAGPTGSTEVAAASRRSWPGTHPGLGGDLDPLNRQRFGGEHHGEVHPVTQAQLDAGLRALRIPPAWWQ